MFEDEYTADELAELARRHRVRRIIVVIVVVAMVVALVVPIIIRSVRRPAEPDGIVAVHVVSESRRMGV